MVGRDTPEPNACYREIHHKVRDGVRPSEPVEVRAAVVEARIPLLSCGECQFFVG